MTDHYTKQRIRWINSVSPFHKHETRLPYMMWWVLGLICGARMPHEVR